MVYPLDCYQQSVLGNDYLYLLMSASENSTLQLRIIFLAKKKERNKLLYTNSYDNDISQIH